MVEGPVIPHLQSFDTAVVGVGGLEVGFDDPLPAGTRVQFRGMRTEWDAVAEPPASVIVGTCAVVDSTPGRPDDYIAAADIFTLPIADLFDLFGIADAEAPVG